MTITSTHPDSGSPVSPGSSIQVVNTSPYILQILLRRDGWDDEPIYSGGAFEVGYLGTRTVSGTTETITFRKDDGWIDSPFQIVIELTGSNTTLNYVVYGVSDYPALMGVGGMWFRKIYLNTLLDVDAPDPGDLEVLSFDAATQKWIPRAPGTPGPHALDSHTDVNVLAATEGQVLTLQGGVWVGANPTGGGGVTDHGALTGLTPDDDHPQYLLVSGARAMTGGLNMGGQAITNVGDFSADNVLATTIGAFGVPLALVDATGSTGTANQVLTAGGSGSAMWDDPTVPTHSHSLFSTTTTTSGFAPGSNNLGSTYFLRADGTWAVPPSTPGSVGTLDEVLTTGSPDNEATITSTNPIRLLDGIGGGGQSTTPTLYIERGGVNWYGLQVSTTAGTTSTTLTPGGILFEGSASYSIQGGTTLSIGSIGSGLIFTDSTGSAGTTGQFLGSNGSGQTVWGTPTGGGNVTGPGTSTVGHVATFNNTTGTLLADMGANALAVNASTGEVTTQGGIQVVVGNVESVTGGELNYWSKLNLTAISPPGTLDLEPASLFPSGNFEIASAASATAPYWMRIFGGASSGAGVKAGPLYLSGGLTTTGNTDGGDVNLYGGFPAGTGQPGTVYIGGFTTDGFGGGLTERAKEIYLFKGFTVIESAARPATPVATKGQFWVKNETPCKPYFTDDAGNDFDLTDTGAGGTVDGSGTAGYYARWLDTNTLEGRTTAQVLSDISAVPTSRSITAGAGLTGTGTLASDITLAVGAGTGVTVAADSISVNYGTTGTTACVGNDARLSDARTPTAHTHPITDLTGGTEGQIIKIVGGVKTWTTDAGGTIDGSGTTDYYARWTDSNTLEGRTVGQVLSDIGAAPATHTHPFSDVGATLKANLDQKLTDLGGVTGGLISTLGQEFTGFLSLDSTPATTDLILLEDGTTGAKKYCTIDDLPGGSTGSAYWKDPVRASSIGNENVGVTMDGLSVDGVSLVAGNRVLLLGQSTASQNGIWEVLASPNPPQRPTDFAVGSSQPNAVVYVQEGTARADVAYVCTNNAGSAVVNTNSLTFQQINITRPASIVDPFPVAYWNQSANILAAGVVQSGVANTVSPGAADTLTAVRAVAGGTVTGAGAGACVLGNVDTTGGGTATMNASGVGSLIAGACTTSGSGTNQMTAAGNGSQVMGVTATGGKITTGAAAPGALARGFATTGTITATGFGAASMGYVAGSGNITASGSGATSMGYVAASNAITASGAGSLAVGDSTSAAITASAANSVQIGPGSNAQALSLMVGGTTTGIRLTGGGAAPTASLHNGDIWVLTATGITHVRSGGLSVGIAPTSKSFVVENPEANDSFAFFTTVGLTIAECRAVCTGGTPSVTYYIVSGADRSSASTLNIHGGDFGGADATSETTGDVAGIDTAGIAANTWVILNISAATDCTRFEVSLSVYPT